MLGDTLTSGTPAIPLLRFNALRPGDLSLRLRYVARGLPREHCREAAFA